MFAAKCSEVQMQLFLKLLISPPVHLLWCEYNGMWYVLGELVVISVLLTKESSWEA